MSIIIVGLSHRTAPLELREKLALSVPDLQSAFATWEIKSAIEANHQQPSPIIHEMVILSTCNRLEVYASVNDANAGVRCIEGYLAELQEIPIPELATHLYRYSGDAAIQHLMRVACGLDSMILGESQILGQVARAYEDARNKGMTGAVLSRLFGQATIAGKRARTETHISRHTTSVSHAAALLIMEKINQESAIHVLLIGAGEMAALAAQALKRSDIHNMMFVNRTYERAEVMAHKFGGSARSWFQLQEALIWADAVVCATGAPHIVIDRHLVEAALQQREGRPLVFVDIAVPRDVEAAVGELSGVKIYDIDNLQSVVDANVELRKAAIPQVETIIQQEMARFAEWYHSHQVTPVIKTLHEWAQSIADDEITQTLNRFAPADERTREIVSRMAHRLVNRLLHEPTYRLRIQANEGNGSGYAHAVRELFALHELDALECRQLDAGCAVVNQTNLAHTQCTLQCILPSVITQQT